MISQDIARRYGRAIYEVAVEEGRLDDYFYELTEIADLLQHSKSFRSLMLRRGFTADERREVLGDILLRFKIDPKVSAFLFLLVQQKRIQWLNKIVAYYRALMDEAQGILRVKVSVPGELSPEEHTVLSRRLAEMTGKRIDMDIHDDPTLLGGVVIRYGDMLYDGSLKTQLYLLRRSLLDQ